MSTTPAEQAPKHSAKDDTDDARYAVYDLRYLKFVGDVLGKRPSKAQAEKIAGHDDVEVREV